MIKSQLLFVFLFSCFVSMAQLQPTEPDQSPMDMCYSPAGYPILKFQANANDNKLNARVIFSRPQVKGRHIFGSEVKYHELWRMGANEATELQLFKDATIGGKKLLKGRYTLYCIPEPDAWTIIVNADTDSWGGFSYRPEKDLVRVKVPVQKVEAPVEFLTMYFDSNNNLVIIWSDVRANLPVRFMVK